MKAYLLCATGDEASLGDAGSAAFLEAGGLGALLRDLAAACWSRGEMVEKRARAVENSERTNRDDDAAPDRKPGSRSPREKQAISTEISRGQLPADSYTDSGETNAGAQALSYQVATAGWTGKA